MSEFELIAFLQQRLAGTADARIDLGIGDDAALITPRPGHELALCCDSLVAGRHFPHDAEAGDVAWKALAVNLSDLAAMAATPVAALLALSLPKAPDAGWLDDFCAGWSDLAQGCGIALIGGDTTRGPVLSLTVTCLGEVPAGTALRRGGAQIGDGIYVTGSLGDAAMALPLWPSQGSEAECRLRDRLCRPQPRLALGQGLRTIASSAIDVSDGLAADLGHVLAASAVGAEIDLVRLPLSDALIEVAGRERAGQLALAGGDDYELCFTAAAEHEPALCALAAATATRVTRIGTIVAGSALVVRGAHGEAIATGSGGWDHFRG